MRIQEVKAAIAEALKNPRENDAATELAKQLKCNESGKYKGKIAGNDNTIIFLAFPDAEPKNPMQQIQMEQKENKLQIRLCAWNRTPRKQETMRCPEYDFNISDHPLSDIKECLKKIREEKSNWFNENEIARETAVTANIVKNKDEDTAEETTFQDVPLWKSDSNPWYNFNLQEKSLFVLEKDAPKINGYNINKQQTDKSYIHLEIPPQPYIGNPDAPIWILTMNPSYSAMDIYDMVREDENAVLNSMGWTNSKCDFNNDAKLEKRKTLMQEQLKFSKAASDFYVLDEQFHTINKHSGRKKLGSYEWWAYYLLCKDICNGDRTKLRNFFVLESFPYHSKEFGKIKPDKLSQQHFDFWKKMVQYALKNGKILLCRTRKIAKMVYQQADREQNLENIIVLFSPRRDFPVNYGKFGPYAKIMQNQEITKGDVEKVDENIKKKIK